MLFPGLAAPRGTMVYHGSNRHRDGMEGHSVGAFRKGLPQEACLLAKKRPRVYSRQTLRGIMREQPGRAPHMWQGVCTEGRQELTKALECLRAGESHTRHQLSTAPCSLIVISLPPDPGGAASSKASRGGVWTKRGREQGRPPVLWLGCVPQGGVDVWFILNWTSNT